MLEEDRIKIQHAVEQERINEQERIKKQRQSVTKGFFSSLHGINVKYHDDDSD
jgi:hypothetical protein